MDCRFVVDNHLAGVIRAGCCQFNDEFGALFVAIDFDGSKEDTAPALEEDTFDVIVKEGRVLFEFIRNDDRSRVMVVCFVVG